MLYNKNSVRKVNDKKVLHKVRGRWLVLSTALLLAIGGGVMASGHASAHADTTNNTNVASQLSSNLIDMASSKISPQTQAEINSLETPPATAKASIASSGSTTSASASTGSSNEAYMPVASSYVQNDGGSAASYHAQGYNDSVTAHNDSNLVKSYVASVNTNYKPQVNKLASAYNKAVATSNDNNTKYQSASSLANNQSAQATVSNLASKSGLTVQDYSTIVGWQTTANDDAVKSDQGTIKNLNSVYNAVQKLSSMASNPYLSADNVANSVSASANSLITSDQASNAKTKLTAEQSASNSNFSAITSLSVRLDYMSGADYIATHIYNNMDEQTASSVASASNVDLGTFNNAVASYTRSGFKPNSNYAFTANNNSNSAVNFNGNTTTNVYQLLSDVAAESDYATNYYNLLSSLNNDKALSASYTNQVQADSVAVSNADSIANSAKSVSASVSTEASFANSVASNHALTVGDIFKGLLNSSASDYSALQSVAAGIDGDNLSAGEQSLINSLSTADNTLTQAQTSSANYATSTDADATLASSAAVSLSADMQNDSTATSDAKSALDGFYNSVAGSNFTSASSAANSASVASRDANELATAYGMHEYNYGPKHVVVLKKCLLHSSTNFNHDDVEAVVDSGYMFDVLGVGFSSNGSLRYLVSDGQGNEGFIAGSNRYVRNTYLQYTPDQLKQPTAPMLNITLDSGVSAYKSAKFNHKNYVKRIKAGKVVKGQLVYENDNTNNNKPVYGGFTRIKLSDGLYITANTNYVHILNEANVQPAKPAPAKPAKSDEPAIMFD